MLAQDVADREAHPPFDALARREQLLGQQVRVATDALRLLDEKLTFERRRQAVGRSMEQPRAQVLLDATQRT
ncbi:MAG: hypothetical protein ABI460_14570 [Caldimonas sp.]